MGSINTASKQVGKNASRHVRASASFDYGCNVVRGIARWKPSSPPCGKQAVQHISIAMKAICEAQNWFVEIEESWFICQTARSRISEARLGTLRTGSFAAVARPHILSCAHSTSTPVSNRNCSFLSTHLRVKRFTVGCRVVPLVGSEVVGLPRAKLRIVFPQSNCQRQYCLDTRRDPIQVRTEDHLGRT